MLSLLFDLPATRPVGAVVVPAPSESARLADQGPS